VVSPTETPNVLEPVLSNIAVGTEVVDGVRYLKINNNFVYQYSQDATNTALGVSTFWMLMSSTGAQMTSWCLAGRRLLEEREVDTHKCGAAGMETYIVSVVLDTPNRASYDTLIVSMEAQRVADETGDIHLLDALPSHGLHGTTEIRDSSGSPVYICGRPTLRSAERLVTPAPKMPPSPPPPAPPGLTHTVTGSIGANVLYVNNGKDYWITYDGGYLSAGDTLIWTRAVPFSGLPGCAQAGDPLLYPTADPSTFHYGGVLDAGIMHSIRLEGVVGNVEFHACVKLSGTAIFNYRPDLVAFTNFEPPSAPPPPSPPPSPPHSPPPDPPPPIRHNVRQYFSYGSTMAVLILAVGLMASVYLRRGIELEQKDVERVIKETPVEEEIARGPYNEPQGVTVQPALVSVPLGRDGWGGSDARANRSVRKRDERQSLLG